MTVAHEAAAWVVVDVAALCVELAGLEWHDINIAVGEEGRAVGGAGGRGALSMRVNRMAQAGGAFLWDACVGWFALLLLFVALPLLFVALPLFCVVALCF